MDMPLHPGVWDLALRLALTVGAGALIGFDRGVRGHTAGLRTTLLVALAAAAAMIQANILMSVSGKTPASFGVMDLMRLPLGILTGVGFIGGGAILRRGDMVAGVTTAATLWVATVIGLCFGGGQLWLGGATTILTLATLSILKWVERRIAHDNRAVVTLRVEGGGPPFAELAALLGPLGCRPRFRKQSGPDASGRDFTFDVHWMAAETAGPPLAILDELNRRFVVRSFEVAPGVGD